jgi:prepilin-type processing-associated H-X9-DG protein
MLGESKNQFSLTRPALSTFGVQKQLPININKNGANLSFADGHVEHHRWRYHRVVTTYSGAGHKPVIIADDLADLQWLQEKLPHTP